MNTNYWTFKVGADGNVRVDVLVETTDRDPADPIPDVLTVVFWNIDPDVFASATQTIVSSDQLVPTTAPAGA